MTSSIENSELLSRPLPEVYLKTGERIEILSDRVSPKGSFYPVGFSIDDEIAENLVIHDIRVGNNSQVVNGLSLPGSIFSSSRPPYNLCFDRLWSGMNIRMDVTNTGASGTFRGSVVGFSKPAKNLLPRLLGFGHTEVSEKLVISVKPQLPIEPCFIYVSPTVLDQFDILHIHGERYLDIDEIPVVPSHMLTDENLRSGGRIKFSHSTVISAGSSVTMMVSNKTSKSSVFSAVLLGRVRRCKDIEQNI